MMVYAGAIYHHVVVNFWLNRTLQIFFTFSFFHTSILDDLILFNYNSASFFEINNHQLHAFLKKCVYGIIKDFLFTFYSL